MVYPRTGGGNSRVRSLGVTMWGLSPHGRGKQSGRAGATQLTRSIPARAGETGRNNLLRRLTGLYPRTGGGNSPVPASCHSSNGLSPHGRGKRPSQQVAGNPQGSIPARAGETDSPQTAGPLSKVYPRTGGGNCPIPIVYNLRDGLSPHGRGKPARPDATYCPARSIPARAGETTRSAGCGHYPAVYPRTGGGNLRLRLRLGSLAGLSPHGRGKPSHSRRASQYQRSIPARAGETAPPA